MTGDKKRESYDLASGLVWSFMVPVSIFERCLPADLPLAESRIGRASRVYASADDAGEVTWVADYIRNWFARVHFSDDNSYFQSRLRRTLNANFVDFKTIRKALPADCTWTEQTFLSLARANPEYLPTFRRQNGDAIWRDRDVVRFYWSMHPGEIEQNIKFETALRARKASNGS